MATASAPPPGTVSRDLADVSVGEKLPSLTIPITRTLIVAGAIASRDYQDVHHDAVKAVERGSKDIFMNILTTNGLVGRYITDWTGPGGVIRRVSIRLGAPNYPDDEMVLTGEVLSLDPESGVVEVSVRGTNSYGDHVVGTVEVEVPRGS